MEEVLHRGGVTATVAAAVASAGLIAVTPAALPRLDLQKVQQVEVQLTATDLFTALAENLNLAGVGLGTGLTDLLQLDLPGAAANFASAVTDVNALIPENILLAGVSGLLGQSLDSYITQGIDFPVLADWSQVLPDLQMELTAGLNFMWQGVQELFQGDLANSLLYTLSGENLLFIAIPELFMVGIPALLDDNLLSLVGL